MIDLRSRVLPPAVTAIILASVAAGAPVAAQEFAVASIRQSDPHGVTPRPQMGPLVFFRSGTLTDLICLAYELERYQVAGGPRWEGEQRYDIQARAEAPTSPAAMRFMLRALLVERFRLQAHRGSQTMKVYALAVSKGGRQLKESAEETPRDGIGAIQVDSSAVRGRGVSMSLLARYLTLELGRPVLDETRLAGHYDFDIGFGETKPAEGSPESFGTIAYAVKYLGLKLESKSAAVPVLIVDRAEPPSAN
ncbi:MAG: TIGR03435 family protein [Acidobacteriota bacterium]|nr:TIGR03435 family protein [Acidobacteriota bacterium]